MLTIVVQPLLYVGYVSYFVLTYREILGVIYIYILWQCLVLFRYILCFIFLEQRGVHVYDQYRIYSIAGIIPYIEMTNLGKPSKCHYAEHLARGAHL